MKEVGFIRKVIFSGFYYCNVDYVIKRILTIANILALIILCLAKLKIKTRFYYYFFNSTREQKVLNLELTFGLKAKMFINYVFLCR